MHCDFVNLTDGTRMIVCGGRRKKFVRCHSCGAAAKFECDYKIGPKKTCDLPMCGVCSVSMGEGVDYCRSHHALIQRQGKLFEESA